LGREEVWNQPSGQLPAHKLTKNPPFTTIKTKAFLIFQIYRDWLKVLSMLASHASASDSDSILSQFAVFYNIINNLCLNIPFRNRQYFIINLQ
jgi:hypothetical protein